MRRREEEKEQLAWLLDSGGRLPVYETTSSNKWVKSRWARDCSYLGSNLPEFDQLFEIEENVEEEEVRMTETMEQYMSKTRGDYGLGVTRPLINQDTHFELKGKFLKELRDNTFSGSEHEDANEHIEKVLEIVDLFHILKLTQDQIMLRAFPVYLTRARHEENSTIIKEIQASINAAIRNQGASIKTLELQIGQMSKVLQERGFGCLPSSTETNLKDQVKSISTAPVDLSDIRCASVSVMPFSTYINLGLGGLSRTRLTIELADRTIKEPRGIAENVLVRIGKFVFPIDFIILDIPEDDDVPLILRRPFLSTAHTLHTAYRTPKDTINYGVTCKDEATRHNSGTKMKTFEENCYLLLYAIFGNEDTAYQLRLITRIRVIIKYRSGVSPLTYTPYAQLAISQRYAINMTDGN
nr:hypothetical protein [Tanacetum cinerariifolium]